MKQSVLVLVLALALATPQAWSDYRQDIQQLVDRMTELAGDDTGLDDSQRFGEIVSTSYDYSMLSYPEFATFRGDPRGQDRWTDTSEEAVLKRRVEQDRMLAALENIDRSRLIAANRPITTCCWTR
jgi:hypothetical protein